MSQVHYEFSVPVCIKALGGLKNVLAVAGNVAHTHPGGEREILEARLAPDMFPFLRQVQIACDNAKGIAARLSGKEAPVFADDETTLAELGSRIDKTVTFLESLTPLDYEGAETRRVELPYFKDHYMTGDGYLKGYALPNFFFHVTTAYNIIRMLGGELGKKDYMNGVPLIPNEA